ncbi:MAG TPA: NUDIX domain-containing protein [Blastocatellia bacterium]|nr:NUDIX domain-containing protein [Blastocatellia bacterium]
MAGGFIKLDCGKIESALEQTTRQYLVGRLQRPQILTHIDDDKVEIGITSYKMNSSEAPHTHSQAYEYQYMLSGYTAYLDLDSGEEISFRKGDFYVVTPGTKYAQKSKPGTTILFIKVPPGNDKINIEPDARITEWLQAKIVSRRIDYHNDPNAPAPNSIKPAVAVALFNEENKLLIIKRKDSGNWAVPSGTLEFGEDLIRCGIREVKEETGFDVELIDMIGTYTNPKTVVAYTDGEVRQEFTMLYEGRIIGGEMCIDDESTEIRWESIDELLKLSLAASQRQRIEDIVAYKMSGKRAFK